MTNVSCSIRDRNARVRLFNNRVVSGEMPLMPLYSMETAQEVVGPSTLAQLEAMNSESFFLKR